MAERIPFPEGDHGASDHHAGAHQGPEPGFRIGEYVLEKSLGHGAMGTVYLAKDGTGHEVALKLFQEGPGVSATMLERFRREAEAAKKLRRHPNIMKVYATGQQGIYHYIVMEPVRHSRTFDDVISDGPTEINAILATIIKIARALHFAHSRHIIHRDVKPGNIMIDEFGEPLLSDFGVAAMVDWPGCTMTGTLTGTPLYMSPEQARSERVGPASDLYSLGVALYEAVTGVLPYTTQHASPVKAVLEAVKNEMPARPRSLRKEITPELEAVIMKALEKNPDDRYPDAEAFALDLERARSGHHVSAHLFTFRDYLAFRVRRHRSLIAGLAAAMALFVTTSIYFQSELRQSHYEYLVQSARLRSEALRGPRSGAGDGPDPQPLVSAAQQEWVIASREINRRNMPAAVSHLKSAIQISAQSGDRRTEARAQKELARIRTLEGNHDEAMSLYQLVLANRDAPAADLNQARLEAIILALLYDRHEDAYALISEPGPASGNIFRNAIRCITGELSAADYRDQISYLPGRLQNDAHLALALRYRIDDQSREYRRELQQAIRSSSSVMEWPGPLARRLYEESAE